MAFIRFNGLLLYRFVFYCWHFCQRQRRKQWNKTQTSWKSIDMQF